jgi:hypothetical protein
MYFVNDDHHHNLILKTFEWFLFQHLRSFQDAKAFDDQQMKFNNDFQRNDKTKCKDHH